MSSGFIGFFFTVIFAFCLVSCGDTGGSRFERMSESNFRAMTAELHICSKLAAVSAGNSNDKMFAVYIMDAAEYYRMMNFALYDRYCENKKMAEEHSCYWSREYLIKNGLASKAPPVDGCDIRRKTASELTASERDEAIKFIKGCALKALSYAQKYIEPAVDAEYNNLTQIYRKDIAQWRGEYVRRCTLISK